MKKQELIVLYYKKNMTLQAIGDRFGVTRERVRQVMEKYNLPRNTKRGGRRVWEVNGMKEVMPGLCHDCSAKEGELHQLGCDMEDCPFCGGQLITCEMHGGFPEEQFLRIVKASDQSRIPWVRIPNFCGKCGLAWPKMFEVPDEEWEKFVIPELQGKMLCRPCYDKMKTLFPDGWRDVKEVNHETPLS